MKHNIELAVILAAGCGTRIHEFIEEVPKGFIRIGGRPIIEHSIETLLGFGIKRIVIVTGYFAHFYDELKKKYPEIETVGNPKYRNSGSMYSFFEARNLIDQDFLLLESDLIYEKRAVEVLMKESLHNVILVSGRTGSGDEVYVDSEGVRVTNITKDRGQVIKPAGELVGISRLSRDFYSVMVEKVTGEFEKTLMLEYETDTMAGLAKSFPLNYRLVEDLAWSEIDNQAHFLRARDRVYPEILENNRRYYGNS